jgi:hypothetical protein
MKWYEILIAIVIIVVGAIIGIKAKEFHRTSTTMIVEKVEINRKDAVEVSFFV